MGGAGHRLHAGPDRLARADPARRALSCACTGCRRSSAASSASPPSSGRSCARSRTRTCGSSCARRSPTRRATSRSSTASTPRSACSRPTRCRAAWTRPREHLNPEFGELFDELLHERVDRLAREPEDIETLVEAITIYHMVAEGMLALTGQHFIIDYNEKAGTLPGFVAGLHAGRARRAPPRRVRRALPARHGAPRRALCGGDPARAGGGRARRPTACCGRSGSRAPTRRPSCSASRSRRRARSR